METTASAGRLPLPARAARLPNYAASWAALLAAFALTGIWLIEGSAYFRRRGLQAQRAARARGEARHFIGVLMPAVDRREGAFPPEEFTRIIDGLDRVGYSTIGFSDVRDFYRAGRPLPAKSILIAFDRDHPRSIHWAEKVLKKRRMRAAAFQQKNLRREDRRRALSPHAVRQLRRGGAWDFGTRVDDAGSALEGGGAGSELRFLPARTGYNDRLQSPAGLRLLRVRPTDSAADVLLALFALEPRKRAFEDSFQAERLRMDWTVEWGIISAKRRLAILPTPRQTGASLALRGTETWSDMVVEYTLKSFKRAAWMYAREIPGQSYLRLGASEGHWRLQQLEGKGRKPVTLAKAPVTPHDFPARLRLVLKGEWAIASLNGRLLFAKPRWVPSGVAEGRVSFGVYDPDKGSAGAILSSVRAAPLPVRWLSFSPRAGIQEIRSRASELRALAPQWIRVDRQGLLDVQGEQQELLKAIAGFYRCDLVAGLYVEDPSVIRRMKESSRRHFIQALWRQADALGGKGLLLRVGAGARPEDIRGAVSALRSEPGFRRRKLWVAHPDPSGFSGLRKLIDGVLVPEGGGEFEWLRLSEAGDRGGHP